MTARRRPINDPEGRWWAAYDNGEVWPVTVLRASMLGTTIRSDHDAAPPGEHTFHPSRVYDSGLNHPEWGRA